MSHPGPGIGAFGFNAGLAPFDDVRVRRAFVLAIDRERYARHVSEGRYAPANGGYVPPGVPGHSPDIGLPYDPVAARQLLAQAGYPGGRGFPAVTLVVADLPNAIRDAQYLQARWREELGVNIHYEGRGAGDFGSGPGVAMPHLFFLGWVADYPDPDNFLRVAILQYGGGWHDETYIRLVEEAKGLADQQARLKLYRQADRILIDEAALLPLLYGRVHMLVKPWIRLDRVSPTEYIFWKDVTIAPH